MRNVSFAIVFSCAAAALAACGGGGGSSSGGSGGGGGGGGTIPTPTPTPQGSPYALPSASPNVLSVFSINSNPTALAVKIDGTSVGNTPATASPAYALTPHTISITAPGTAAPYVVTTAQTANGPRQVYYNSAIDTAGKITSGALTSIGRRPAATFRRISSPVRLAPNLTGRPLYSSTRLAVTYDVSALGSRNVDALERRHGVASAVTLAQGTSSITRVVTVSGSIDAARTGLAAEAGVAAVTRIALRYPQANADPPNDAFYTADNGNDQWDMQKIGMETAWGYGYGSSSVAIAIVDTGYDPNQTEVAPNVTYSEKVYDGYKDTASLAATDTNGHGTVVSGIASAVTNNGVGFAGVGYGTALQEYKIYGDSSTENPSADTADEAEAIRDAVANHAKVILLALGGSSAGGPDPVERDAVAYAIGQGVTVVAASGDEAATTVDYPAALPGVIAVGASAVDDASAPGDGIAAPETIASYSNTGPGLTLVAPGGDATSGDTDQVHYIANAYTTQPYSGIPACTTPNPASSCYLLFTGTSMAAAHVAGAAGLILAHDSLTPAQMLALLSGTADNITGATSLTEGAGRLNVGRAMAAATGNAAPAPSYVPTYNQFVAFAYTNVGGISSTPTIVDVTYPHGTPVNSDGTFRIADLPTSITTNNTPYKIAVWYDANGNGRIDAGDYFGVSNACAKTGQCSGAGGIAVHVVSGTFTLP
jgi:subtilisin family serine protease